MADSMAFATAGGSRPGQYDVMKSGNRPVCSYCHKIGHTIDRCFEKNGYPPGLSGSAGFTQHHLNALYSYFQSHNSLTQPSQQGPGVRAGGSIGMVAHVSSGRLAGTPTTDLVVPAPTSILPDFAAGPSNSADDWFSLAREWSISVLFFHS
ncbi:hypothetical protein LINPERPRIM_LOCUS2057 [Linum perenne]